MVSIRRLSRAILVAGLASLPLAGSPLAQAKGQQVVQRQKIAIICEGDAGSPRDVVFASRSRLIAAIRSLVQPGTPGAVIYWRPITDQSYGAQGLATIVIPPIPTPQLTDCNPFDPLCKKANAARKERVAAMISQTLRTISAQTSGLLHQTFPQARTKEDPTGCVQRASELVRKNTTNYLILVDPLAVPPAPGASFALSGVDLDLVRVCTRDYATCHASKVAWSAAFRRSGTPDQLWLDPSQLPVWQPIGKS